MSFSFSQDDFPKQPEERQEARAKLKAAIDRTEHVLFMARSDLERLEDFMRYCGDDIPEDD